MKQTTPLKTIRQYCLACCGGDKTEVRLCPRTDCEFYPFRLGSKNGIKGSLLKIIKAKCKDCGEGTAQAVRKCEFLDCEIYQYRNGKNEVYNKGRASRPLCGCCVKNSSPVR